jgi:hypothetical protein
MGGIINIVPPNSPNIIVTDLLHQSDGGKQGHFSKVKISESQAADLRKENVMLGNALQQHGIGPGLTVRLSFTYFIISKFTRDQKVIPQRGLLPVHVPIRAYELWVRSPACRP